MTITPVNDKVNAIRHSVPYTTVSQNRQFIFQSEWWYTRFLYNNKMIWFSTDQDLTARNYIGGNHALLTVLSTLQLW